MDIIPQITCLTLTKTFKKGHLSIDQAIRHAVKGVSKSIAIEIAQFLKE